MGIRNVLVAGVKTLSKIIDDVKSPVSYQAWVGDNGRGKDEFAPAVTLHPFVSTKKRISATGNGKIVTVVATLTFADPVADTAPNAGKDRKQPVDPRDIFTLADGTTAPIVDAGGPINPGTARPFALKVVLGTTVRGQ